MKKTKKGLVDIKSSAQNVKIIFIPERYPFGNTDRSNQRNREPDSQASVLGTKSADLTAVVLNNGFAACQAKSGTPALIFPGLIDGKEF